MNLLPHFDFLKFRIDPYPLTLSGAVERLCTTFFVLVFFIFPIDFGTLSMQIYTY